MRYYILQDIEYDLIQVDSVTRKTSNWSCFDNFTSLDVFVENTYWDINNPTFNTYKYTVLVCSNEKITKQTNPELFI